jgi:hypothetical protein
MYLFQEERYIARIYYESMRDNFEGYAWEPSCTGRHSTQPPTDADPPDQGDTCPQQHDPKGAAKEEQLRELKRTFDALDPLNGGVPTLGQLFKIELALIWLVPDQALRARFWTIEDRFRRVVPSSVIASYVRSLPPVPPDPDPDPADQCKADGDLRQRARNLLDVIHANYLINLGRENTIKRMMTILSIAAVVIVTAASLVVAASESYARHGIAWIIVAGMAGAMISIVQRLQKATSRDAMVEDGIFELIGLRVGWVSVMMSIGIGGVFALFLYALVIANMIDLVLPELAGAGDGSGPVPDPASANAAAQAAATEVAGPPPPQSEPAAAAAGDGDGAGAASAQTPAGDIAAAAQNPPAVPAAEGPVPAGADVVAAAAAADRICCPPGLQNCMWVDKVALAIGLASRAAFFKMLATAFIAGFAERLVPDIINRLGKQDPGGAPAMAGSSKAGS